MTGTGTGTVVRSATAEDYEVVSGRFATAMMFPFTPTDEKRAVFEPERTLVAESGGEVVGTARALTRTLSVPGGIVPAAHVTGVGVAPTSRRRGVLSALMRRQLDEATEPVAALWASDPAIYRRYGYEYAGTGFAATVDLPRVRPLPVEDPGTLHEITAAEAADLLPPVLAEFQRTRPGVSGRGERHWTARLADPPEARSGGTPRQLVVHRAADGRVDGYAAWRGKSGFDAAGAAAEVELEELVAVDGAAHESLWHHLLTMDLAVRLRYHHLSPGEPVWQRVGNPRALTATWHDTLWLRILDVPGALTRRRYQVPVDVVLDVTDEFTPGNSGRFRLTADADEVHCERTDAAPDLSMRESVLAGVYLGGRGLGEFAGTGRVVEHRAGALAATAAAFGWPVAPGPVEIF
ncbi:putative acetyltransferase [Stackebrandtia albiflava]|uniref:Putative acetyltransferase n=1 Tax=Stackebrandtia albiflava TaxID=406432 RepID=A0A562VE71_9ACTN|nr:GNAT family N-acetyltransferase [Stackebrandtia albiflava]TWJ16186.1 putative acetyltransferase [Stackebrandtia albiflava]